MTHVSTDLSQTQAPRNTNIPAELRALPQWVCWKYIIRDGKNTKTTV